MAYSKYVSGVVGSRQLASLGSRIWIEEDGAWRVLSQALNSLPGKVRRVVIDSMDFYAHKYHQNLLQAIDTNGSQLEHPWEPLSPRYLKAKSKAGANTGMYQWTGNLRRGIMTKVTPNGSVTVGIPKDAGYSGPKGRLLSAQVALVLQNGSIFHGIPPRPLFLPVWRKMGGNAALGRYVSTKLNTKVKDQIFLIKK